jgi:hypothetical protein
VALPGGSADGPRSSAAPSSTALAEMIPAAEKRANETRPVRPTCPTQPKLGSILFDNVGSKWCVSTGNYGGRDRDRIVGQSLGNDGEEALDGI